MNDNEKLKFPGFSPDLDKNYWKYPTIMDLYNDQISGAECKVLIYILRRTIGWRKLEDKISLSQFKHGIINKKTGKITDKGTGIKNDKTILIALNSLEKMGFFTIIRGRGKPNIYRLRLLTNSKNTTYQNKEVATGKITDTVYKVTTRISQNSDFRKNKKAYYQGDPMRYVPDLKKWYVIHNGEWLEYAGKMADIEWRDKKPKKIF